MIWYSHTLLFKHCCNVYRKEGAKQGGELDLGGVDNTHYTGELYYEEVIEQEYWKIEMDS